MAKTKKFGDDWEKMEEPVQALVGDFNKTPSQGYRPQTPEYWVGLTAKQISNLGLGRTSKEERSLESTISNFERVLIVHRGLEIEAKVYQAAGKEAMPPGEIRVSPQLAVALRLDRGYLRNSLNNVNLYRAAVEGQEERDERKTTEEDKQKLQRALFRRAG
ncbi:MAG: hypothetical protein AABW48_04855, partial [Nanoarchaeota archaeon]